MQKKQNTESIKPKPAAYQFKNKCLRKPFANLRRDSFLKNIQFKRALNKDQDHNTPQTTLTQTQLHPKTSKRELGRVLQVNRKVAMRKVRRAASPNETKCIYSR